MSMPEFQLLTRIYRPNTMYVHLNIVHAEALQSPLAWAKSYQFRFTPNHIFNDYFALFICFQYLGDLERVSGVRYLEPNRNYTLPIITHSSLVFPGETLPMILSQHMFLSADFNDDGLLFGLVFRELRNNQNLHQFGVTCQIYEKGTDERDNVSIKSRAYQRFFIKTTG